MKDSISCLLRCQLELNHAKKQDHIIEAAYCERVAGHSSLKEGEWKWIIKQIYDPHDAERVIRIIEEERGTLQMQGLYYDDLVQYLLSYRLAKQQKFIQPLVLNRRLLKNSPLTEMH